jgi:hypothetical protein
VYVKFCKLVEAYVFCFPKGHRAEPRRAAENGPRIREPLLKGAYQPQPSKRVKIPTPGDGEHPLGIPAVLAALSNKRQSLGPKWPQGSIKGACQRARAQIIAVR